MMRAKGQGGFTLLEVMIAMAIMVIAFASILMVQSNSLQASVRAREINTASMLLKQMMIETEYATEGKRVDELRKEETGQFKDPFQDYSWKREVKEIKFPNIASLASAGGAAQGESGSKGSESSSSGVSSTVEQLGRLVTNYLSKALREITVTISWKSGSGTRSASASMYWVDLNRGFDLTE